MERRAYTRYTINLDALFSINGLNWQACRVRNFCLGGMFIGLGGESRALLATEAESASRGLPLEIEFAIPEGGGQQRFRLRAKVARVLEQGIGIAFEDPDSAALEALQRLAGSAPERGGVNAGGQASGLAIPGAQQALEACRAVLGLHSPARMRVFYQEAGNRLVDAAGKAESNALQGQFFDALNALNKRQGKIEKGLPGVIEDQLMNLGGFRVVQRERKSAGQSPKLELIDKDAFEDFLIVSEMVTRAEDRFEAPLEELEQRFSRLANQRINATTDPLGPAAICHAFDELLSDLEASPTAMRAIYRAFEAVVVASLGNLYKALNETLEKAGITPLEPEQVPVPRPGRSAAGAVPQPAVPPASEQPGVAPEAQPPVAPELAGMPGPAVVPGAPGIQAGYGGAAGRAVAGSGMVPGTGQTVAPDMAGMSGPPAVPGVPGPGVQAGYAGAAVDMRGFPGAAQSAAPAVAMPGSVAVPGPAVGTGPAPAPDARGAGPGVSPSLPGQPQELMQAAYAAAQTLLGLQRQVVPRGPAGSAGTWTVNASPEAIASGAPLPAYSADEILDALSVLQRDAKASPSADLLGTDFRARLQETLGRKHGDTAPRRIGEGAADVLDMVAHLFGSIFGDILLPESIKERMVRLQPAMQKAALLDQSFFQSNAHPARQVLNQLARLEEGVGDEGAWAIVDPAIQRIVGGFDRDMGIFSEVASELGALLESQRQSYSANRARVVQACEDQQAFVKKRETEGGAQKTQPKSRPVPADLQGWLDRARRLRVGDVVALRISSQAPLRATLAWIGEDSSAYVFVDGRGEKAETLTLQELAIHLRRGTVVLLQESELSVVDRAVYSMLHDMHGQLEKQATHDRLTGLANRREFVGRLDRALKRVVQEHEKHVLCWLEVDGLEAINDSRGQEAGDAVLTAVAELLDGSDADQLTVGRLGARGFGLLLERSSTAEAYRTADGLRTRIQGLDLVWCDEPLSVTASIGLIVIVGETKGSEGLLKAAQAACRAAVNAGGNQIKAYRAGGQARRRKGIKEWMAQLDKTISEDRVELRCQRVESLAGGQTGPGLYEIMLGLRDDAGELLPSAEFLQAAEYHKRLPTLDRWVIRAVLRWMSENGGRLKDVGGCVITLSSHTLGDGQLLNYVMDQLMESKVPPGKVCFKITDPEVLSSLSEAEQFIRTMKEFGCRFSLGGLAGGDSSYSYIKSLPVDYVKIEGAFVKDIAQKPEDYAVVQSMNEIAHFMGKKTIAEHVESEDVQGRLQDIGVDYVQGYWIEEPIDLAQLGVKLGPSRRMRPRPDTGEATLGDVEIVEATPGSPEGQAPADDSGKHDTLRLSVWLAHEGCELMAEHPEKLGKYEIMGVAGRGSMGVVYMGHDPFVDRKVAVKVCTLEEEEEARARARKMFFNEAQAAGSLDHPNILKVYDAGEADDEPYIVMEYVAGGETLRTYCDPDNLLPVERVIEMVAHCARTLHYAHDRGVTHRDIKPANIMLTEDGVVKIGDFGIAQRTHTDKTQILGVFGSPRYMSPEQAGDRQVGGQSDLFSLGVVLYELLSGSPPFMAKNLPGLVYKILHDSPQPIEQLRPDLPAALVQAVNHALEKDTAKRYKTGEEMAADLTAILEELNRPFADMAEDEQLLALQELRFFEDFSESEVAEVRRAGTLKTFPVGEPIIQEGAEADSFYIVISGGVRVTKNGRQVGLLSAGESFGEMGYLSDMTRTAAVLAVGSVTVLEVDADVKEWASFPCQVRLTKTFQRILIERLARITEDYSQSGR